MVHNSQDVLLGERLLMGRIRMGPLVGDSYCEMILCEELIMGSRRRLHVGSVEWGSRWGVFE